MIRSMTAFARTEVCAPVGHGWWELRSVNHRYLDMNVRLPEEWRLLESAIRERITKQIRRGKIDCVLRWQAGGEGANPLQLNVELTQALIQTAQKISALLPNPAPLSITDLLRWPGLLATPEQDLENTGQLLLAQLDLALEQLISQRQREGKQISELLTERCLAIAEDAKQTRQLLPAILNAQQEKLRQRLAEVLQSLDNERLEQEMVILAQKMDVAEELDRLETHLQELRQLLQQGGTVGRRLDFLLQEMHREANTLGAKSIHLTTTSASINFKVLIEQIREQVQNIE